MSFRARLILFFALIVLVPVGVVAMGLAHLADESRSARTDAALGAAANTALSLYASELESAAEAARAAGRDPALARALRANDRAAAQRAVDRLARGPALSELAAAGASGRVLARFGAPSPASVEVGVDGPRGSLGSVTAATLRPARFVARASSLTGVDAAILTGDVVLASTVAVAGARLPPMEGGGDVEAGGVDARALTAAPEGAAPGARVALIAPRASAGITASPLFLIGAAIAFVALGLALVLVLVRALGGQVREMLCAARRIGGGDFSQRVPVVGNDELAGLAREFNTMSERLDRQMAELRSQGSELRRSVRHTGRAFAAGGDRRSVLEVAADAALSACDAATARGMMTGEPAIEVAAGDPSRALAAALREAEDTVLRDRVSAESVFAEPGRDEAFAFAEPVPGARGTRGRRAVMAVARAGTPFGSDERETLRYLAGQVAVALENIERHELATHETVPAP